MKTQELRTVGEIAASSLAAVNIFEKHGIDYCCGGKRMLDDICREKGLAAESLRQEIDLESSTASNSSADWSTESLRSLIQHIIRKHHAYLKVELPRVGMRLSKVVQVHGSKDPVMLEELDSVYGDMWQELDMHMRKEEMMLFPSIERYEAAIEAGQPLPAAPFGTIANPIGVMEAEHASAGWALGRIRELTRNFQSPDWACATYRALLHGLKSLESDLHVHIHLENNILFPRVIAMEARR